jgi:uncharacterized protein YegJ (DUF2314 family)
VGSGVELNQQFPDTFEIPPASERSNLKPGRQWVKLVFHITGGDQVNVERMWVMVDEKHPGYYLGTLNNQPYSTEHIRNGMQVRFEQKHVIQIRDVTETERS